MKTTSLAAVAGAVAALVVVACTDSSQKSITAPVSGPRKITTFDGGLGHGKTVTLCVEIIGSAPAGPYHFTNSGINADGRPTGYGLDGLYDGATGGIGTNYFVTPNVPKNGDAFANVAGTTQYDVMPGTGGSNCIPILTRSQPDDYFLGSPECPTGTVPPDEYCTNDPDTWAGIGVMATSIPSGALYDHTDCLLYEGTKFAVPNSGNQPPPNNYQCGTGNIATRAYANTVHGTVLTFFFKADPKPPAPAPCTSLDTLYPYGAAGSRTATVFNESGALSAYGRTGNLVSAWYTDEHALTLGVDSIFEKNFTPPGNFHFTYPMASMLTTPDAATHTASATGSPLAVGSLETAYLKAAFDGAGRPLHPALFVTDISPPNQASTSGDWQIAGGGGLAPTAIYGTWKGAIMVIDSTKSTPTKTITPRADPAKNHNIVGPGGTNPTGTPDLGYSAQVVWDISSLDPNKNYRLQFMVHDGDQNKTGGDVGQACITVGPQSADPVYVIH